MNQRSVPRPLGTAGIVVFGYLALVCGLTWPLPVNMATQLTGSPTGDLGVYVWNLWIFRHELVEHGRLPVSTDHVFAFTNGVDFSLHNYTPLAGLVGTPLMPWLGVVATFNAVLLLFLVASALGLFVLGRHLGLGRTSAWIAGALFIASPAMTARETAHFSLVTAAALPLFIVALLRAVEGRRRRDAAMAGALVALATYSDAYYGIYCVIMGLFLVAWRVTRVDLRATAADPPPIRRWLDIAIVLLLAAIAGRVLSGPVTLTAGPLRIALQTLYSPLLTLVVLLAARAWLTWRPAWRLDDPDNELPTLLRRGALSVLVCLTLILPLLVGVMLQYLRTQLPETATFWRSSPRGVDLLAYFVPNPMHPWFGGWTHGWLLPPNEDAFPELVASFSLCAWVAIAVAAWRGSLPRRWVAFTALFMLLSLGPFIHLGGINTQVAGPWALLRYVPVIGMARSPSRFGLVAILGLSLLFAFALEAGLAAGGRKRWLGAMALVAAVAFEVLPAPRTLYSAAVPDVYRIIAASREDSGRILELPTGIRDGTSSLGDFNASAQFFQTRHGRPLLGGYLSRVSEWRKRESRRAPVLRALFHLSARRGPLPPEWLEEARRSRDPFLRRSCVAYVILDKQRSSSELREFAVDALNLLRVHEDDAYELLVPQDPPPCTAPLSRRGGWGSGMAHRFQPVFQPK